MSGQRRLFPQLQIKSIGLYPGFLFSSQQCFFERVKRKTIPHIHFKLSTPQKHEMHMGVYPAWKDIVFIKINFFSNPKMAIEGPLSHSHNPSILYGKPIYFSFIKGGKKVAIIKKGISVHAFSAKHRQPR